MSVTVVTSNHDDMTYGRKFAAVDTCVVLHREPTLSTCDDTQRNLDVTWLFCSSKWSFFMS